MRELILSPSAQRDVDEIFSYSEMVWGTARAQKTLANIYKTTQTIAANPKLGRVSDVDTVRQLAVPRLPFVLLYKITADHILLLQVLHTKRHR